jgi:2-aminoadipate transaminase
VSDLDSLFSTTVTGGGPHPFSVPADPKITWDFAQAQPGPETYPVADLLRVSQTLIDRDGPSVLDYYDPAVGYPELAYGSEALRHELAEYITLRDGRPIQSDGVVLAQGSAQAISLAIRAFLDPGEGVIVESTTFLYALRFIRNVGAVYRRVSMDSQGLDPSAVEKQLWEMKRDGIRPKMIYTISTFHVPSGTVLAQDRRKELLDIAAQWDLVILEDHVYGELRLDGAHVPTLLSMDPGERVIQVGSFSKTVFPGIRLGWAAGSGKAISALATVREDLGVSQWNSRIMSEFLRERIWLPHIEGSMGHYRAKRDTAVTGLQTHCAEYVDFNVPAGSFFIWMRFIRPMNFSLLRQLANDGGVECDPGEDSVRDDDESRYMRMAFSKIGIEEIERGCAVLGEAMTRSALSSSNRK